MRQSRCGGTERQTGRTQLIIHNHDGTYTGHLNTVNEAVAHRRDRTAQTGQLSNNACHEKDFDKFDFVGIINFSAPVSRTHNYSVYVARKTPRGGGCMFSFFAF